MVISGQTDFGIIGIPGPVLTSMQGKSVSAIYGLTGGGAGAGMVAALKIKSMEDLQSLPQCRIGTLAGC